MDVDDSGLVAESAPVDESGEQPKDLLAVIEDAVDAVRAVDDAPLEEHAEQYQAVHASLQAALSDTDLRDTDLRDSDLRDSG